ncbi:alpha/beta hydrolase [Patulibacter minatonensis]|uniref:poly(ethylene terephthalate) hydrolase family protein n=1 Tax=Patulibacter minatonensis TaxID=298163 RepID=UPI00047EE209|nr:alpha/beta hydrolase [Patulibacter minatonensis]
MLEPSAAPRSGLARRRSRLAAVLATVAALATSLAATQGAIAADPADPLAKGPYEVNRSYYNAGNLQLTVTSTGCGTGSTSPTPVACSNGLTGLNPGDSTTGNGNSFPQPLEGTVTWPTGDGPRGAGPYPVILLQHGRHNACVGAAGTDGGAGSTQAFPAGTCPSKVPPNPVTGFWPSWEGYEYMADDLASHGYVVISVSAGALVTFDNVTGSIDAGGLARAQIIANSLDLLKSWNTTPGPGAVGSNLIGKLDFSRVAIMGHSRGGEGVTQYITYNRQRPGARYNLTGAFALAPIDRNKQYPQGTNYATLAPACDGDVSSISGWNAFERSKYGNDDDPFAKYGFYVEGANHNWYNTRWVASDRTGSDSACGSTPATARRLTMAEQRATGLATMELFLRLYGGGESALKPWITGESGTPASACPSDPSSKAIACPDLIKYSYIAPAAERQDIVRPGSGAVPTTASPTAKDDAGGTYTGSGFATFDWCNPDPFANPQSANPPSTQTTTPIKACAGPNVGSSTANSYNRSMGPQLALAWDGPATLSAGLRGDARDATRFRSLSFRAAYQFTDVARNPLSTGFNWDANPTSLVAGRPVQDLRIALVDRSGAEKEVKLTDHTRGIESTLGQNTSTTQPRHIALQGQRIPLSAFTGIDLKTLDRVELRFGGAGVPATGAIQLADLAFQEPADPAAAGSTGPATVPLTRMAGDPVLPKLDAVVTDRPAVTAAAAKPKVCVDRARPTTKLAARTVRAARTVALRGTATDTGCVATRSKGAAKGVVERVQVSISLRSGSKCRFLTDAGRLTKGLTCGAPLSLVARGRSSWNVRIPARRLPKGRYVVRAVSIDGAGNVSRTAKGALKVG